MTTPTRLSDDRASKAMTEAEADALFGEIAALELHLTAKAAKVEKQICELKNDFEAESSEKRALLRLKAGQLNDYIKANPERFAKPRARAISQGKYGLRKVSDVAILDAEMVVDYADRNSLDLYEVRRTVEKKAVQAVFDAGGSVPGAAFRVGEVAFYKVDKKLIDAAKA